MGAIPSPAGCTAFEPAVGNHLSGRAIGIADDTDVVEEELACLKEAAGKLVPERLGIARMRGGDAAIPVRCLGGMNRFVAGRPRLGT